MEPIRTLVVDDAADLRFLYRKALEDDGRFAVVAEAADGIEALDAVTRLAPALLLLDVELPGMHGSDVLAELRRRPDRPAVVMVSGHERDARPAAGPGDPVGYLSKGQSPRALPGSLLLVAAVLDRLTSNTALGSGLVPPEWRPPLDAVAAAATLLSGPEAEPLDLRVELTSDRVRIVRVDPPGRHLVAPPAPTGEVVGSGMQDERWGTRVWCELARPDR